MQPTTEPLHMKHALRTTFNPAMEDIRMSPIVSISEEARTRSKEFEKSGQPFVFFQRGEIDFPTPAFVVEAAKRGLDLGLTKYPKSGGEDFFKDAVAKRLRPDHDSEGIEPSHIVATYGGQEGLELSFKLFKSGAGFSPTWSCALENFVPFAQLDFVEVPLNRDFSVDFDRVESAVRGREFFYLNNPQNPTGKVFTESELGRIVDICTRHGVFIIADEAYEKIVYEGRALFVGTRAAGEHHHGVHAFEDVRHDGLAFGLRRHAQCQGREAPASRELHADRGCHHVSAVRCCGGA